MMENNNNKTLKSTPPPRQPHGMVNERTRVVAPPHARSSSGQAARVRSTFSPRSVSSPAFTEPLDDFGAKTNHSIMPMMPTTPPSSSEMGGSPHQTTNGYIPYHLSRPSPSSVPMRNDRIVWIDCEMTGLGLGLGPSLDADDRILEIGLVITNDDLDELESISLTIHQTGWSLNNMSEFARKVHSAQSPDGSPSLISQCADPSQSVSKEIAESIICNILDRHCTNPMGRQCKLMMAGSSIYMDKMFIKRWMPAIDERLHYKVLDVTSFLEAMKRYAPSVVAGQPANNQAHRVMSDIRSSIDLMRHYKDALKRMDVIIRGAGGSVS